MARPEYEESMIEPEESSTCNCECTCNSALDSVVWFP